MVYFFFFVCTFPYQLPFDADDNGGLLGLASNHMTSPAVSFLGCFFWVFLGHSRNSDECFHSPTTGDSDDNWKNCVTKTAPFNKHQRLVWGGFSMAVEISTVVIETSPHFCFKNKNNDLRRNDKAMDMTESRSIGNKNIPTYAMKISRNLCVAAK